MLIAYAEAFDKIEQRYGVPAPILVAIWGLESEFGADSGHVPTFSALARFGKGCDLLSRLIEQHLFREDRLSRYLRRTK